MMTLLALHVLVAFAAVGFLVVRGRCWLPHRARKTFRSSVAFGAMLVIGIGYHMRWEIRVLKLALASPDDAPSTELTAAIDDTLGVPMLWVSALLWIAIVYLMVAKPF